MTEQITDATEATEPQVTGEPTNAPETPVYTVQTDNVPPSWADVDDRQSIHDNLALLAEAGWTRPMLRELTGFSDSTVWRAQKGKTHFRETRSWFELFERIATEKLVPSTRARKLNVDERLGQVTNVVRDVIGVLSDVGDERSIKKIRETIEAVVTVLSSVVPEPAVEDGESGESGEVSTDEDATVAA